MMQDIPGGDALVAWYGRVPLFHDAELLEISFGNAGQGRLRLHGWELTNAVGADGFLVTEKHALVTLTLAGVTEIHCADFATVPGIILDMEITREGGQFQIDWSASYGVSGLVKARWLEISLTPGKPSRV